MGHRGELGDALELEQAHTTHRQARGRHARRDEERRERERRSQVHHAPRAKIVAEHLSGVALEN